MSKFLILRHGITEGNKNKWFYGKTDLPLIQEGKEKLRIQKESGLYPEIPEIAQFFTTGLRRTDETLREIFGEREYESVPELQELNFGVCECRTFDDMKDDQIFLDWVYDESGNTAFPEGESNNQFSDRISRGFRYLLDRHSTFEKTLAAGKEAFTVLICHGGVIADLMDKSFPGEKESKWEWMPEPGCGYVLDVEEGELKNPCLLGEITVY